MTAKKQNIWFCLTAVFLLFWLVLPARSTDTLPEKYVSAGTDQLKEKQKYQLAGISFGPVEAVEEQVEELDNKANDYWIAHWQDNNCTGDASDPECAGVVNFPQKVLDYWKNHPHDRPDSWAVSVNSPSASTTSSSPDTVAETHSSPLWRAKTSGVLTSAPAVDEEGTVYFGSYDKKVYALYPDGSEKWTFTTGGAIHAAPALGAGDTLYVASEDKYLYALDTEAGNVLWKYKTAGRLHSSPAISSNGIIYVGCTDNKLYAIRPDSDGDDEGELAWTYTTGGRITSSPTLSADSTVYVGSWDKNLYAVRPDNSNDGEGELNWKVSTGGEIKSSPALGADGTIYFGSHDKHLYALNSDGTEQWSSNLEGAVWSSPVIGSDSTVYVGSWNGKLYALNHKDGSTEWTFTTGERIVASPLVGSKRIYVGSHDNTLYALNPDTPGGPGSWKFSTGEAIFAGTNLRDTSLYVVSGDNYLYALEADTSGLAQSSWPKFGGNHKNTGQTPEQLPEEYSGPTWYVNDDTTAGDVYTSAPGSNENPGSPDAPFLTISRALEAATTGDTIMIDAGTYGETVAIDTNSLALVGADSSPAGTVIDAGDSSAASKLIVLRSDTVTNLQIKNLRVANGYWGLILYNTDNSLVENVMATSNKSVGIGLVNGSEFNTLSEVSTSNNDSGGLTIDSANNLVKNSNFSKNGDDGLSIALSATANIVYNNLVSNNDQAGINVEGSDNEIRQNQIINNNLSTTSNDGGLELGDAENGEIAENNLVVRNLIKDNYNGIELRGTNQNLIHSNELVNNAYHLYLEDTATTFNDTFTKNNLTSAGDSLVMAVGFSGTEAKLLRNWWGMTDEIAIQSKIQGPLADAVVFQPYRLNKVDTGTGADTLAPATPVADTVAGSHSGIALSWNQVNTDENNNPLTDFAEYRIYKTTSGTETDWKNNALMVSSISSVSDTDYVDTSVTPGETYYYRITAVDSAPAENESFFSSTLIAQAKPWSGPTWYVNDNYTGDEIYTSTAGSDTNTGGPSDPFRTISEAMSHVAAEDTILVDAGTYGETVAFITDGLTLAGAGSTATSFDFGDSSTVTAAVGIYSDTHSGLLIKNLSIRNYMIGLSFSGVSASRVENVTVENCGESGMYLWNSGGVVFNQVVSRNNIFDGLTVDGSKNINVISSRFTGNDSNGLVFIQSDTALVKENHLTENSQAGLLLDNTSTSLASNNLITGNNSGMELIGGFFNEVIQNDIRNNTNYQVYNTTFDNLFRKNNLVASTTNPDSVVKDTSSGIDFIYNWWGTTAHTAIDTKLTGFGSYEPYRLGQVDTAPGADTMAFASPIVDTAVVLGSDTVEVRWQQITTNEEGSAMSADFNSYVIYRSTSDTVTDWKLYEIASLAGSMSDTDYIDTDVTPGQTYYYRITALDDHTLDGGDGTAKFDNESYFSSTIAATPTHSGPTWYVNDNDTAGDVYTSAVGSETHTGGPSDPFRTISEAMNHVSAGDTILVDAGTYGETVAIDTNSLALVGADSQSTIIDSPGANVNLYASNADNISIRKLGVQNSSVGIELDSITNSLVENVHVDTATNNSLYLYLSDSNTIRSSYFGQSDNDQVMLYTSSNNLIEHNMAENGWGRSYYLQASSNDNKIINNLARAGQSGIVVRGSDNVLVADNTIRDMSGFGISAQFYPVNLRVLRNTLYNVGSVNLELEADGCYVAQNTVDSPGSWAVQTNGGGTITKNNIYTGTILPDSGALNSGDSVVDLTRNWWNTTDENLVARKIYNSGAGTTIYSPYRLGLVDTGVGADTVAPATPVADTAFVVGSDTIEVRWQEVTADEDGSSLDFNRYNVHRSKYDTETDWLSNTSSKGSIMSAGDTSITDDNNLIPGQTYYYRVLAKDASSPANSSFFSDSMSVTLPAWNGPTWYVNDNDTTGDVHTSAVGSDSNTGGPDDPFRTISYALSQVSAGDTVLVDAGTYGATGETITLSVNDLALVGADSATTILDFGDTSPGAGAGLYALNRQNLQIRDLAVKNSYRNIYWDGVTYSNIDNVRVTNSGYVGVTLLGSDTNVIKNSDLSNNYGYGISFNSANDNQLRNSSLTSNYNDIEINSSSDNTISENHLTGSGADAIILSVASQNKISNNVIENSQGDGIYIANSQFNTIVQNEIKNNNDYQIYQTGTTGEINLATKNNIAASATNPDSLAYNDVTSDTTNFTYNYWNSTDSAVISSGLAGAGNTLQVPYLLRKVDTGVGADTNPPAIPANVVADTVAGGTITISWDEVTTNQDGSTIGDFEKYTVYRLRADTVTDIKNNYNDVSYTSGGATDTSVTNSPGGLASGDTYYYVITAIDNPLTDGGDGTSDFINESYFSTMISVVAP